MIYELARSVQELLAERNFPARVEYGPERTKRDLGTHSNIVVFGYDRDSEDTFGPPKGQQRNPRKLFTHEIAAHVEVYARSNTPSAHIGDHERECRRLVSGVVVAIYRWAVAERCPITLSGGAMMYAEEYEQYPGVAYRLRFRVPTSIFDFVYTPETANSPGDPLPEAVVTDVTNSVGVLP